MLRVECRGYDDSSLYGGVYLSTVAAQVLEILRQLQRARAERLNALLHVGIRHELAVVRLRTRLEVGKVVALWHLVRRLVVLVAATASVHCYAQVLVRRDRRLALEVREARLGLGGQVRVVPAALEILVRRNGCGQHTKHAHFCDANLVRA